MDGTDQKGGIERFSEWYDSLPPDYSRELIERRAMVALFGEEDSRRGQLLLKFASVAAVLTLFGRPGQAKAMDGPAPVSYVVPADAGPGQSSGLDITSSFESGAALLSTDLLTHPPQAAPDTPVVRDSIPARGHATVQTMSSPTFDSRPAPAATVDLKLAGISQPKPGIVAIGDSWLVGMKAAGVDGAFQADGFTVLADDARVGRPLTEIVQRVKDLTKEIKAADGVVIEEENSTPSLPEYQALLGTIWRIHPNVQVGVVTPFAVTPRLKAAEAASAAAIKDIAKTTPHVTAITWDEAAATMPQSFGSDGVHPKDYTPMATFVEAAEVKALRNGTPVVSTPDVVTPPVPAAVTPGVQPNTSPATEGADITAALNMAATPALLQAFTSGESLPATPLASPVALSGNRLPATAAAGASPAGSVGPVDSGSDITATLTRLTTTGMPPDLGPHAFIPGTVIPSAATAAPETASTAPAPTAVTVAPPSSPVVVQPPPPATLYPQTAKMAELAKDGLIAADKRRTVGNCLGGVNDADDLAGLHVTRIIPASGEAALLAQDPRFKEIPFVNRQQLKDLPPGMEIVWSATKAYPYGHIGITEPNVQEASDNIGVRVTYLDDGSVPRIFYPVDDSAATGTATPAGAAQQPAVQPQTTSPPVETAQPATTGPQPATASHTSTAPADGQDITNFMMGSTTDSSLADGANTTLLAAFTPGTTIPLTPAAQPSKVGVGTLPSPGTIAPVGGDTAGGADITAGLSGSQAVASGPSAASGGPSTSGLPTYSPGVTAPAAGSTSGSESPAGSDKGGTHTSDTQTGRTTPPAAQADPQTQAPVHSPAATSGASDGGSVLDQFNSELRKASFTDAQIAGIDANVQHESGTQPMRLEGTASGVETPAESLTPAQLNNRNLGWGFVQDTPPSKIIDWARQNGLDPNDPKVQARFLLFQLDTSEKAAGDALRQTTTPETAAQVFEAKFERPASLSDAGQRASTARSIFNDTQKKGDQGNPAPAPQKSTQDANNNGGAGQQPDGSVADGKNGSPPKPKAGNGSKPQGVTATDTSVTQTAPSPASPTKGGGPGDSSASADITAVLTDITSKNVGGADNSAKDSGRGKNTAASDQSGSGGKTDNSNNGGGAGSKDGGNADTSLLPTLSTGDSLPTTKLAQPLILNNGNLLQLPGADNGARGSNSNNAQSSHGASTSHNNN